MAFSGRGQDLQPVLELSRWPSLAPQADGTSRNQGMQFRGNLIREPPRIADANFLNPDAQDLEGAQPYQDLNPGRRDQYRGQHRKGREYVAAELPVKRIECPDFGNIHGNDK